MLLGMISANPSSSLSSSRSTGNGAPASPPRPERQRSSAPRHLRQPRAVALQGPEVRQPPVRKQHRLGALHVSVAGHDQPEIRLRAGQQRALQPFDFFQQGQGVLHEPQAEVGGDLVVAAAPGVQLAAG